MQKRTKLEATNSTFITVFFVLWIKPAATTGQLTTALLFFCVFFLFESRISIEK